MQPPTTRSPITQQDPTAVLTSTTMNTSLGNERWKAREQEIHSRGRQKHILQPAAASLSPETFLLPAVYPPMVGVLVH